jgi:selenoprotein W-related protein
MVQSSGGVFEVSLEGELIFSKKTLGRHPVPGEVLDLVRKKRGRSER